MRSLALGGQGDILMGDGDGRIVAGSRSGGFGAPQSLPGGQTASGDRTLVAANARGDRLVAYRGVQGFLVDAAQLPAARGAHPSRSRRRRGASLRAAVIADTGEGVVTWAQSGTRTGVFAARFPAPGRRRRARASRA